MKKLLIMFLFLLMMFVSPVFAIQEGEDVNFSDLPTKLSEALNIDLFSAKILASIILVCIVLFPALFLAHTFDMGSAMSIIVVVGLPMSGFCVALGWLPVWIFFIVCFIIALMFSGEMRSWITGRGGT